MNVISVREHPDQCADFIAYFQSKWATAQSMKVYEDSITHAVLTPSPLPEWYLLKSGKAIVGCAGLITNDFISRMDLYPWGNQSRIYRRKTN